VPASRYGSTAPWTDAAAGLNAKTAAGDLPVSAARILIAGQWNLAARTTNRFALGQATRAVTRSPTGLFSREPFTYLRLFLSSRAPPRENIA